MFVPLRDVNPLTSIKYQYVTVGLIVVNIAVYLIQVSTGAGYNAMASFAVVPRELFESSTFGGAALVSNDQFAVPEPLTLLTYMFVHAGGMHLFGNMLFLWVFGDNVEDALGHARFLVFYLACGVAGALVHALLLPDSDFALIGASGAISGVIAAYLMMHPRVRVWVLALKFIPLKIPAGLALGLWIVFQFVMVVSAGAGETAWLAHVGGLLAGAFLILVMRRKGVALFGR